MNNSNKQGSIVVSGYSFKEYSLAGSKFSLVWDINNLKDITLIGGTAEQSDNFKTSGGALQKIDVAGTFNPGGSEVHHINDHGEVVGVYNLSGTGDGVARSYISQEGNLYEYEVPLAQAVGTYTYGLNNSGVVSGSFRSADGNLHGFIDYGSRAEVIDLGDHIFTEVTAINDRGGFAGSFHDEDGFHGFISEAGHLTVLDPYSVVWDLNNNGVAVVDIADGSGYVFDHGQKINLSYGDYVVRPFGINDANDIVGGLIKRSPYGDFLGFVANYAHIDDDKSSVLRGTKGADLLVGTDKSDTIRGLGGDDTLNGGRGDDDLNGNDGNDLINGGDGNDIAVGGSGNDEVNGGAGDDRLFGQDGNDLLRGGTGNDKLFGDAGNDQLFGQAGNDTVFGGAGADTLRGDEGNDRLFGDAEWDILRGGAGDDQLTGGADADVFFFGAADRGSDRIMDFTLGEDHLDLRGLGLYSASDVFAVTTENAFGDAVISTGGVSITLAHVTEIQLQSASGTFLI